MGFIERTLDMTLSITVKWTVDVEFINRIVQEYFLCFCEWKSLAQNL
jgi:hypothetical protein